MAFQGNGVKLSGNDGKLQSHTFGSEVLGDGVTPLPAGLYIVTGVGGSSAFPSPALSGDGIAVGDVFEVATGVSFTPASGDDLVTLVTADRCDVSSWAMEFSAAEVDVTTQCDTLREYVSGTRDMAGTLNGVFKVGTTDSTDGYLREFIAIAKQDAAVSYDKFEQTDTTYIGSFFVNKDINKADIIKVVGAFKIYGISLGGELDGAQAFSSSFRFAPLTFTRASDSVQVEINPVYHRLGDGT